MAARLAGVVEGVSGMFIDEATVPTLQVALYRFLTDRIQFNLDACRDHEKKSEWHNVIRYVSGCHELVQNMTTDSGRVST